MKQNLLILLSLAVLSCVGEAQEPAYVEVHGGDVSALKEAIIQGNERSEGTHIQLYGEFKFGAGDELPAITGKIWLQSGKWVDNGGVDRLIRVEQGGALWLGFTSLSGFSICRAGLEERYPLIENYGDLIIDSVGFRDIFGTHCAHHIYNNNPLLYNVGNLTVIRATFDDVGYADTYGGLLTNEGLAIFDRVTIQSVKTYQPIINSGEMKLINVSYLGSPPLILGPTTVVNSIFAGTGGTWCSEEVTSLGHNLTDAANCNFHASGDIMGTPAGLLPLKYIEITNFSDFLAAFPLSAASPAIDSADPDYCSSDFWVRGDHFLDGNNDGISVCDRGAFEFTSNSLSSGGANGLYYDPDHNGHYVYVLDNDYNTLVMWTTFDRLGNQAWVFAIGKLSDGRAMIANAFINQGGTLTENGPVDVQLDKPWGTLQIELDSCAGGRFFFNSELPEFESGEFGLKRLANVNQIGCQD